MEALFIYLIKSSGLIALFYFGYYFLLRQETFFNSNRWFLQLGLFTALLLPLVVFSKTVVVEASTNTSNWSKIPIATSSQNLEFEINWYLILLLTYCLGAFLFLAKFVFDFYSLNSILKGTSIRTQANYKLIDTTENIAPFSYFGTIVYNSSLYNQQELTNILAHEKIHCDQNHSVDVLISRVFCILFWFNPIVWFYKKAILQNLEFIADHQATTKIEDKKSYQITLLKITTQENRVAITNHFYQSLIKKRIVMLNKNQSKKRNSWKYAVLIPALIAFVVLFQIEVVAQEAKVETQKAANQKEEIVDSFIINKDTSDKELLENLSQLKTNYGIDGKISKVKRNSTNEIIAYKINFKKGKDISKILEIQQSTVIEPIAIVVSKTEKGLLGIEFSSSKQINNSTQQGLVVPDAPVILENEIYIDGIKTSDKEMNNIDSKDIQSIDVIKSSTKQGIRIITKKFKSANKENAKISESQSKPVIIINGKKADPELKLNDINPDTIATVSVLKGKNAIDKYGKEAKNGAIEITLKTVGQNIRKNDNLPQRPAPSFTYTPITNEKINKATNLNSTDNEQIIKGVNSSLNLENADPTNLNNKQKSKTSKKIVIVKKGRIASNTIPEDTEIYIDGTKSSKTELDNISPDLSDSIDITRSATNEKMLKVTTKKKH